MHRIGCFRYRFKAEYFRNLVMQSTFEKIKLLQCYKQIKYIYIVLLLSLFVRQWKDKDNKKKRKEKHEKEYGVVPCYFVMVLFVVRLFFRFWFAFGIVIESLHYPYTILALSLHKDNLLLVHMLFKPQLKY